MKLIISKNANINYLAKVVELKDFHDHPDPEVTKLKCTYVDGYNIIVGIDSQPGKYVYFPTSSCINPQFLSFANLYRHGQLNANPEQTGMFEDNGRVKAIKLRGCVSEGFLLPLQTLLNWIIDSVNINIEESDIENNTEFDTVEHNGKSFWICKKYVVPIQPTSIRQTHYERRQKGLKRFNRIIDTQFRFHYDTILIKKIPNAIKPEDLIHMSYKIHGTSGISAYVLTKKPLNMFNRILNWLRGKGFDEWEPVYDYIYSSRTVIKNANYNPKVKDGYYGCDVWSEADKYVRPHLIKGMTLYYEIVGFLPSGGYIQKNYDYGCIPPTRPDEYIPEKHFKVRIYRITLTNPDGIVHEFSPREVQIWCETHNLIPVEECYYGSAGELYPELYQDVNGTPMYPENWFEQFLEKLANDPEFYMEKNSPHCKNKVPHEGLVIKIDNMRSAAFKLKCFNFLNKEQALLDAGEGNIEDES